MFNRREYLAAAVTTGALLLSSRANAAIADQPKSRVHVFTKPIQELSIAEMAAALESWDAGGLEATVRSKGWIDPADAASKLPELMAALHKVNRHGMILCSDINHADHQDVKRVLEPASKLGIRYLRMAYYRYDLTKKLVPQLDAFAKQAESLAAVCKELNMTALYQNHAGANYVGGALWDLMDVIGSIDPKLMSLALDIRHTTVESTEAWKAGYARVRENIGAIFAKDAIITNGKAEDGPLGRNEKGKQLFDMIEKDHVGLPVSMHMEYIDHTKPALLPQRMEAVAKDIKTLKGWLQEA
jgi:sugar phosphate isomerase/epimerase